MTQEPRWQQCATLIQAIMDGAKPEDQDTGLMIWAIGAGLIKTEQQSKPCKTCGTPRPDFRYWRITLAGRMLADAALARVPTEERVA